MAKAKGSAGRPSMARAGDYSAWEATPEARYATRGAWIVSPDGRVLDLSKVTGKAFDQDFAVLHGEALEILATRENWENKFDRYTQAANRGWSTVRMWSSEGRRNLPVIAIRLGNGVSNPVRKAKRMLDKLAGLGVSIYNTNMDMSWIMSGGDLAGQYYGTTTEFMERD